MDLKSMAIQMVMQKLGGGDESAIGKALGSLFGGGGSQGGDGDLDIGGLVGKFAGGDLGGALQSWLGDGDNESVSADQVKNALGEDKVAEFAQQLGIGEEEAGGALSDMLPNLIDKNSSGGDLLGGLAGMAGKLFK